MTLAVCEQIKTVSLLYYSFFVFLFFIYMNTRRKNGVLLPYQGFCCRPYLFVPLIRYSQIFFLNQVSAGGEQAAVAVLLGHGRGGELDQGDGEYPSPGRFFNLKQEARVAVADPLWIRIY